METVTLTIDGRQVTVEKGKTVLQAAIESGISVPYYCYHPGIGIDGSCRVCIVKIEKMPKLQTSCSTVCTDGMVVHTRTDDVVGGAGGRVRVPAGQPSARLPRLRQGRRVSAPGFLVHLRARPEPHGVSAARSSTAKASRADVDFGPTLMLNRNRCILCTRCVRFMRDVEGDAQINIIDRGYGSEIATFQEEGVHSLISGNLMDVCPVGAITTRDYRFKSRPWDNPNAVDTICTLCSKGCNTTAWLKAKPEWAKGSRLDPLHAAVQPRRERLLDVRHRPLRLPLDRERRSAAAAARARRAGRAAAGGLARPAAAARRAPRRRPDARTRTACASCCPRTRRTRSCSCSSDSTQELIGESTTTISRELARQREDAARRAPRSECPTVDAPNVNGARAARAGTGSASATPGAPGRHLGTQTRRRGRTCLGALRVRPRARGLDWRHAVDSRRARARQAAAARRPGRAPDRRWPRRRISSSRVHRLSRRTRPTRMTRAGCRARRGPSPAPGEALEDWQILVNLAAALGARVRLHELRRGARGHRRRASGRRGAAGHCRR